MKLLPIILILALLSCEGHEQCNEFTVCETRTHFSVDSVWVDNICPYTIDLCGDFPGEFIMTETKYTPRINQCGVMDTVRTIITKRYTR